MKIMTSIILNQGKLAQIPWCQWECCVFDLSYTTNGYIPLGEVKSW